MINLRLLFTFKKSKQTNIRYDYAGYAAVYASAFYQTVFHAACDRFRYVNKPHSVYTPHKRPHKPYFRTLDKNIHINFLRNMYILITSNIKYLLWSLKLFTDLLPSNTKIFQQISTKKESRQRGLPWKKTYGNQSFRLRRHRWSDRADFVTFQWLLFKPFVDPPTLTT